MKAPNFRRRPPFVRGIPILRDTLDLNAETPINLQIEKPPRFIVPLPDGVLDSVERYTAVLSPVLRRIGVTKTFL